LRPVAGRPPSVLLKHAPRKQRPYPSDLPDARWELLEPTLTARRAERRGKGLDIGAAARARSAPDHGRRILCVDRTGVPWRYLPPDFAPWKTVHGYFAAWQKDGSSTSSTVSCGAWSAKPKAATSSPHGHSDHADSRRSSRLGAWPLGSPVARPSAAM
jgi:transposase